MLDFFIEKIKNYFGILTLTLSALALYFVIQLSFKKYNNEISILLKDNLAPSFFFVFIISLYILLISSRAAINKQYSLFILGRFQEFLFLKKTKKLILPAITFASYLFDYSYDNFKIATGSISLLFTFFTIYTFVKDISGTWLQKENNNFILQSNLKKPEIVQDKNSNDLIKWKNKLFFRPQKSDWSIYENFLISKKINQHLQNTESILCNAKIIKKQKKYHLPENLFIYAETALSLIRAKGALLHNDAKIRLASDLFCRAFENPSPTIEVQQTSYYASACSNEITQFDISSKNGSYGLNGFDLLLNKESRVLNNFQNSTLSNHMGGGTLAITKDGKIIISKQGQRSAIDSGMLSPTGSGSFDWKDLKKSTTFHQLIVNGLERELIEETALKSSEIDKTIVLGMSRVLSRGGKPDFYGITLINTTLSDLNISIRASEVGFIDSHNEITISGSTTEDFKEELSNWLQKNASICSSALQININLLIEASDATYNSISAHIGLHHPLAR